jgi:DNA-binding NtrC family response regulator
MIQPRTILCIDDACTFLQAFRIHFEDRGYRVLTASSGKEALELLAAKRVDAVILDYQMPGMTGAVALQLSKGVLPGTLVVILSRAASTVPQDARRAATTVLLKDKSMTRLMHSVEGFLQDKLQKT